jgi:hypothetical protein
MRYAVGIPIISGTAHVNNEIRKDQYEKLLSVLAANCLQPVTKNYTFNGEDWTTVIAAEIMNIDEKEGG